MKKIFTITAMALTAQLVVAQLVVAQNGENELRNFRFGLKISPSVNWYTPEGKIISGNGAGMRFGGGLMLEFRLARVASFQTGLQIDLEGGKVKYNNGGLNTPGANTVNYYYSTADDEIDKYPTDSASGYGKSHTRYQLNERQYKATYITIPLMLKLKTKEIGMLTYFGQFGFNTSFIWQANVTDKVTVLPPSAGTGGTDTKRKVDVTSDMRFLKASLAFGGGAEINLSGTTSLVIGLNYNLGFTNVVKSESNYIWKRTNGIDISTNSTDFTQAKMPQVLNSSAVLLTVGVLF